MIDPMFGQLLLSVRPILHCELPNRLNTKVAT